MGDDHSYYRVEGPALISFSGGRSSGYMLKHILDACGGSLPKDAHVCFMNTGKEREESLQFVAACAEMWSVPIHWLEYDPAAKDKTREVSFATANRDGDPFEKLIHTRQYLPNPVKRFCTIELKIRRAKQFMLWQGHDHWDCHIGFRADEPRRLAKMRANCDRERWESFAPLADAGVTKEQVVEWWVKQPFDLTLPNHFGITPAGNCDLCFLKGEGTLLQLIREEPEALDWWVRMETLKLATKPNGAVFRIDRAPYTRLGELSKMLIEFSYDEGIPCFCGD